MDKFKFTNLELRSIIPVARIFLFFVLKNRDDLAIFIYYFTSFEINDPNLYSQNYPKEAYGTPKHCASEK